MVGRLAAISHRSTFKSDPEKIDFDRNTFIHAWDHDLRFIHSNGGKIIIWSAGLNGIFQNKLGSDDIRNG